MIQLEISAVMVALFIVYHLLRAIRFSPSSQDLPVATRAVNPPTLSVSFLVPAWNANDDIPDFVASFQQLDMVEKQLILCAGGPDGSYHVAQNFHSEQIVVLEQHPGMGKQRALDESLPLATGNVIFLTDIDCRLEDTVVKQLVGELSETRTVVTGGIRPLREALSPLVTLQWAIRRCSSPQSVTKTNGLLGANTAMLRSTLQSIGGFSVEAKSGTDYTLAKELIVHGYTIWYVPDCEMVTEFPAKLGTYIHKQSRWLRNVLVIGPRYRAWSELRAVAPTLMLPYVYLMLLIAGFILPILWTVLLLLLAHSTLNRLQYVSKCDQRVAPYSACLSVLGDIAAASRASYQWLFGKYIW